MASRSTFTAAIAEELIDWIASGRTLRAFCRLEGKPAWRTVYDWISDYPDFAERMETARTLGFDAIAEETLHIADTPMEGVITTEDPDGVTTKTEDMLGHRKLQVETRLKLLAKWHPKKYGDKVMHSGDPSAPVALKLEGSDVTG